jgi:hypothetical protein
MPSLKMKYKISGTSPTNRIRYTHTYAQKKNLKKVFNMMLNGGYTNIRVKEL